MTNMPADHKFNVFAIVMCTVCVPFFLLIGSLNTTSGMEFWRSRWHQSINWITGSKPPEDEQELKQKTNPGKHYNPRHRRFQLMNEIGETKVKKRSLSASRAMEARNAQIKPEKDSSASVNGENTKKDVLTESNNKPEGCKPASNMSMGGKKSTPIISAVSSTEKVAPESSNSRNELSPSWWGRLMRRRRRDLGHEHHV